ncbi:hypothetical protein K437DRAFT_273563 [Tilletiaria anomala UBC 951]|uniref:Bromodomain associated domain-containing protein n=1 Tax=Tilletiaria anomala (strain ATCC 24038 / CBS 436.72 / UBC 951) TaxID=1037660 RepID=A0A066WA76_TILAU|nr:uncharacterized protein K437DRAFT_273563 [Tilletiaria anomala UBC 951]KDN47979.1 hypothetical protein K437DRAFT_273563 [Tilletiaria anomala UBC 951]
MTGTGRSPAAVHAHSILKTSTIGIISSTGFRKSSGNAVDLLTEILQRYIALLATTCVSNADQANRAQVAPRDLATALEELGSSVDEVREWVEVESSEEKELSKATGTHAKAAALKELMDATRAPAPASEERRILTFEYVTEADRRAASAYARAVDDDTSGSDDESATDALLSDRADKSETSSSTSHEVDTGEHPVAPFSVELPFIPSHLPPIPSEKSFVAHATEQIYADLAASNVDKGKARQLEDDVRKAREANEAHVRRVIRDVWREEVSYDCSQLRQRISNASLDLPCIDKSAPIAEQPRANSLHAFAADFVALQSERTSSARAGILMTPEGSQQHTQTLLKRRRMASSLADPSRFMPLDSLHAAVSARPSASPFTPSPSLLITLPSDGSAPVFTPTNAHGRSVCLVPPSCAAAQPALGYRWPVQVQSAVRAVAELDIQRKVARIDDPPPLYDSQHVERVFRGMPASRQLLGAAHSALAPALNALAVQQKRKLGAASDDADLELPTKGTLVYTWDWTTKDPFDDTLPGKRLP